MRIPIVIATRVVLAGLLVAPVMAAQTQPPPKPAPAQPQPAQPAPERSRTQGLKETDRFIKAGGNTTKAVGDAKTQVQKTLDTYNGLVTQPSKNMKGDYKKLMKSMDSMNSQATNARQKVDEMLKAGDTYFAGRAENLKGIQDPSLQNRAKQRLAENQKHFASVMQSLKDANDALEPFRKDLADQITFLGSDLNPSATASLKPNAEKLNARGTELFAKADKAIADANAYFQGLKAVSES
jgi:hypothetical protein